MVKKAHRPAVYLRENSWLARIAARKLKSRQVAMVLHRTIHLYGVSATDFVSSASWLAHELQHIRQYEQRGTLGFLAFYLLESIRKGYYRNALEAEARAAENDLRICEAYTLVMPHEKPFGVEVPAAIFAPQSLPTAMSMPRKIPPTAGQKRLFFIHLVVFIVATIAMFLIHASQEKAAGTWVYPWHAWPVAAWALAVIGHWCALWTTYEDKGLDEFNRMVQNG